MTMKSLDEFVELFQEQFDDTEGIEDSTVFHDLDEYSSLVALSIIAMIAEEFDVTVKGEDMQAAVTVEDLYNRVVEKLNN